MRSASIAVLLLALIIFLINVLCGSCAQKAELPEGAAAGEPLEVGGADIKLDKLGPALVDANGAIKRISNWNELTKEEQDVAWKRVTARNAERLEHSSKETGERESTPDAVKAQDAGKQTGHKPKPDREEDLNKLLGSSFKVAGGIDLSTFNVHPDEAKKPRMQVHGDLDFVDLRMKHEVLKSRTEELRKKGKINLENHDEL